MYSAMRLLFKGLTNLELLRKDLKIISSDQMPQLVVAMSTIEEGFQVG